MCILESAAEKQRNAAVSPFGIKMGHLGSVFHDPGLFKKSEERHCPVSMISAYSKVAVCVDSMASIICARSPFRGFYEEERLRHIIRTFMEQQAGLSKLVTKKASKIPSIRIPSHHSNG